MPSLKNGFKAFKQAAKAVGPWRYSIAEKQIICPHCGNDAFERGEAQLNTALSTFFKVDWADKSATLLICSKCSRIEWFGTDPIRLSAE